MATTDDAPIDTRDALEVLESEAKEWDKVTFATESEGATRSHVIIQDAEIDRILKAFRLDA